MISAVGSINVCFFLWVERVKIYGIDYRLWCIALISLDLFDVMFGVMYINHLDFIMYNIVIYMTHVQG